MRNNLFFKISYLVFVIATIALTLGVISGVVWARLTVETAKLIAVTIMAVSGAIMGFLVLYLTMSFETIRKGYGKYALRIFRKDFSIWSLGALFGAVILLGLYYTIYSDLGGGWSVWLFNLDCLWFTLAVGLVFPYGSAILNKSSSGILIERMIDQLTEGDFKLAPPAHAFPATIYWAITESEDNRVDILSNILYHNINEGNSKVATQILMKVFAKIGKIPHEAPHATAERIMFRYLDILQTAFDISYTKRDNVVIKVVLASLTSCSEYIAGRRWGRGCIEKLFDVIVHISKAFTEGQDEDLLSDALWTYYHMCRYQISGNLPAETETWTQTEEGATPIDSDKGWENEQKFEAINKPLTYNLSILVDRTFSGSNNYMIENSIRMMATFAEMIIFDHRMGPIQKDQIGSMLAFQCVEKIKRFVGYGGVRQFGYLNLYIGLSNIITVLQENSRFSQAVLDELISLMDYLIEEGYIVNSDVKDLGGIGRMIVGSSDKISDAVNYISSIMLLQNRIKTYLMREMKEGPGKQSEKGAIKEMILLIQHDIKSYKNIFMNRVPHNTSLGTMIDSFQ